MRVIIAGSRGVTDAARLNRAICASQFDVTYVISGGANGVDKMGEAWAKRQDPRVPVTVIPADWERLGQRAGMVRNCEMAREAEGLIALWDGKSTGTAHMIREAVGAGLHHYIDAACGECGATAGVAIYTTAQNGKETLKAVCHPCAWRRNPEITQWFDVMGMWGNHALRWKRTFETKLELPLPPRTEVPGLVFGHKPKLKSEIKQIRPLLAVSTQESLFGS